MNSSCLIKFKYLPINNVFLLPSERLKFLISDEEMVGYRKTSSELLAVSNAVRLRGTGSIYVAEKTLVLWIAADLSHEEMRRIAENKTRFDWLKEGF